MNLYRNIPYFIQYYNYNKLFDVGDEYTRSGQKIIRGK